MNLKVFKEAMVEAFRGEGLLSTADLERSETVSDIIPVVGRMLRSQLPMSLQEKVVNGVLDTFSEKSLANHGILVNPTMITSGGDSYPNLVLLDGAERSVVQTYEGSIDYRGGAATHVQVVKGTANLLGQKSAQAIGNSTLIATNVSHVAACDSSTVEAWGCAKVVGIESARVTLQDSYAETRDNCWVNVKGGGRVLSLQEGGAVRVNWGGIALLSDRLPLGLGDGIIFTAAEMTDAQSAALKKRLPLLTPWSSAHYRPELTLDQLKAIYMDTKFKILHDGFDLSTGKELVPLIDRAQSSTELATLILPYAKYILKGESSDRLIEHFAPALLAGYNIYNSRNTNLGLNAAFPVHVLGNLAVDMFTYRIPLYAHDTSIVESRYLTPSYLNDQATGIAINHGELYGRDDSFGLVMGQSTGAFYDKSSFLATDRSVAMGYNMSMGTACDMVTVHGMDDCTLQLKDHCRGHLSHQCEALVWDPEVQFIAEGNCLVYVNGDFYSANQEVRDRSVRVRMPDKENWNLLTEVLSKRSKEEQKKGLHR